MIAKEELINLLSAAISTSVRAGQLIMEVYNSEEFQVNLKSDATPLTLADRKAHDEITSSLSRTRIPVLSEEGRNILYEERKGWDCFWLVDPLDGTKEFIKRNGEFTVNVALIMNGYPLMGVVYVPVSGELYFAMESEGSFKVNNIPPSIEADYRFEVLKQEASKLPVPTIRDKFTVVGSRSHMTDETREYIDRFKGKYGEIDIISRGSSLKMCMVAEGKADIYPRFSPTTEWDTAAGQAVAEQAGCVVIAVETGSRMAYNKEELDNPWFIVKARPDIG